MDENDLAGKVIAVTGHRPDKLGGYKPEVAARLTDLAVHSLARLKPSIVITGMALGWDMSVAEACAQLKIPFDAYVPFVGQERMWPAESQAHYNRLLELAQDMVICTTGGYAAWKMQKRNQDMVNVAAEHDGLVLAIFDGSEGGTGNCVRYAREKKVPILNVWDRWERGDF